MTELLVRLFVKDGSNTENAKVRESYGVLSGVTGIILNVILASGKMIFGFISKSISIVADGANNFFDAVSSIISLVGFKISGKPADEKHPFGYGRTEYISAMILSFFVLMMGYELFKASIDKIRNPEQTIFNIATLVMLIFSIAGKIWLAVFNTKIGKKINSLTVKAVVKDSISDIAATTVTVIALICSKYTDKPVDAYMGLLVAAFIFYTGITIIKDTLGPILGEPPAEETIKEISDIVMSFDGICGIHDMILHNYGDSKIIGSLHAEVPADVDVMISHDVIDNAEQKIREELGYEITIHLDPIMVNDEATSRYKNIISSVLRDIGSELTFHDFRMVEGPSHINLIFDVVVPYSFNRGLDNLEESIKKKTAEIDPRCLCVISFDRKYV